MSLNIKDSEAHRLAQALADQTGESMTKAVKVALQERLARIRSSAKPAAKAAELLSIGRRCASYLKAKPVDHDKLLYDAKGLPR